MGKEIKSLQVMNESVFAASGNWIGRYVRGKQIARFITNTFNHDEEEEESSSDEEEEEEESEGGQEGGEEELSEIVLFGNTLVALSKEKRRMYVWDIPPYQNAASKDPLQQQQNEQEEMDSEEEEQEEGEITPYATLEFPIGFTPTKVVHPASYLNKVVVGSKEGELAIWNIRTG